MSVQRMDASTDRLIRTIHPRDDMQHGGLAEYFAAGTSALDCIDMALRAAGRPTITRILDLPCGYGRILRHLHAAFPQAQVVACDLNREAVDFCADTLGAVPVYSHEDPAHIPIEPSIVDLIWVGSLFTHLSADRWRGFLELFQRVLRPGGVLVFTTHGRKGYDFNVRGVMNYWDLYWRQTLARASFERTGYGYAHYAGSSTYGASLTDLAFVTRQVEAIPELRLVYAAESGWAWQHDVFAYARDPEWQVAHHPRVSRWQHAKHWIRDHLPR